jgi:hypothetical protein
LFSQYERSRGDFLSGFTFHPERGQERSAERVIDTAGNHIADHFRDPAMRNIVAG